MRVDVTPNQPYESITSAAAHVGVSPSYLQQVLDSGEFCCGVWKSIDPPRKSAPRPTLAKPIKANGIRYDSYKDAAIACKISSSTLGNAVSRAKKNGKTNFSIKGDYFEIIAE
jgi:hypothetical protein